MADLLKLHVDSPKSIYNICLTSKALYDLAQKYMFRRLRFTFSERWNKHNRLLLERLEKVLTACSTVQEVYVNWAAGDTARLMTKEQRWFNEQLCSLVTRSSALRIFMYVLIPTSTKDPTILYLRFSTTQNRDRLTMANIASPAGIASVPFQKDCFFGSVVMRNVSFTRRASGSIPTLPELSSAYTHAHSLWL